MLISNLTRARNGRRRTLLGLVGAIWIMIGWSIWTSPLPNWQLGHLPTLVDNITSDHRSALLWLACGATAVAAAAFKRIPDPWGFDALMIPAALWTFLDAWSWLIFVASRGHFGNPRSWTAACMWLFAVIVIYITSGWPDPGEDE